MSAIRSWKLVVAGVAAAVVIGGGVGMTVLQLRAGDANEPGPPNVDTLSWVTERGDNGLIVRHPAEWSSSSFSFSLGHAGSGSGKVMSNRAYQFGSKTELPFFRRLPADLAAVEVVRSFGPPAIIQTPAPMPNSVFPLALENATPDTGPSSATGLLLRATFAFEGRNGGTVQAWIGKEVGARDAEIVRRIVSSFGFEMTPAAGSLTLEERMIAHEIAESYRGARTALKGRPHTHPEFAADQTGSAGCGGHTCGLVVFQITGGLRFRVLVDLVERRAIAFS